MRIRSGGHDYDGLSYVAKAPFSILDMFMLRSVKVNVQDQTVWVDSGSTIGELYYGIAEKSKILGFLAGVCHSVGVGGHFSGGGYGNMMRRFGISVDHILDALIVDAEGRVLNRKGMGEDLFWAIRGGGGASFGWGHCFMENQVGSRASCCNGASDIVHQWQYVANKIHDGLFIRVVLSPVTRMGKKTIRAKFNALFLGNAQELVHVMNASFPQLGLVGEQCIQMSWINSVLFWDNFPVGTSAKALLERHGTPEKFLKKKSDYVQKPISKAALEGIWKKMMELHTLCYRTLSILSHRGSNSPFTPNLSVGAPFQSSKNTGRLRQISAGRSRSRRSGQKGRKRRDPELEKPALTLNPYGGKMSEISEKETPFPHRGGNIYKIQYSVVWKEKSEDVANRYLHAIRSLYDYMSPYMSSSPRSSYLNYRDVDIGVNGPGNSTYAQASVWGKKYFKTNFDRLVKIKSKVDPSNFFRYEQSIPSIASAHSIMSE
ncbi:hypothetical protein V8G54_000818 [Vigna mungo]|uniref:FAD-binding PCMH-type domain-containing protein n=1 Tax=Vigna mungo TaxID=3915 RepID=A0AAQ3P692_VIGMU